MKAFVALMAVLLAPSVGCAQQNPAAQQNPTDSWQALRDSARMRPVQAGTIDPAKSPVTDYPMLLEQSRAANATLKQALGWNCVIPCMKRLSDPSCSKPQAGCMPTSPGYEWSFCGRLQIAKHCWAWQSDMRDPGTSIPHRSWRHICSWRALR